MLTPKGVNSTPSTPSTPSKELFDPVLTPSDPPLNPLTPALSVEGVNTVRPVIDPRSGPLSTDDPLMLSHLLD